jgi:hypothetical protein
VGANRFHRSIAIAGLDGGEDVLVPDQQVVWTLELPILDGQHHQVEPQLDHELRVEGVEPAAVEHPDDGGVELQVHIDDGRCFMRRRRLFQSLVGARELGDVVRARGTRRRRSLESLARGVQRLHLLRGGRDHHRATVDLVAYEPAQLEDPHGFAHGVASDAELCSDCALPHSVPGAERAAEDPGCKAVGHLLGGGLSVDHEALER